MRTLLPVLGLICAAAFTASAQYLTRTYSSSGTETISVPNGKLMEIISWRTTGSSSIKLSNGTLTFTNPEGIVLAGPISILVDNTGTALLTYRIFDPSAGSGSATVTVDNSTLAAPLSSIAAAIKKIRKIK